jgi:hypothetical protein
MSKLLSVAGIVATIAMLSALPLSAEHPHAVNTNVNNDMSPGETTKDVVEKKDGMNNVEMEEHHKKHHHHKKHRHHKKHHHHHKKPHDAPKQEEQPKNEG